MINNEMESLKNSIYDSLGVSEEERVVESFLSDINELTQIDGIGDVRAKKLWLNDIQDVDDLKSASTQELQRILGNKTATKLKSKLNSMI